MIPRCLGQHDVQVDIRRRPGMIDRKVPDGMSSVTQAARTPVRVPDPYRHRHDRRNRGAERRRRAARRSSAACGSVARGGRPVSTSKRSATSATVRAIGPRWSSDVLSGTTPSHEISPIVALSPTVPHAADGMRIDPPVSVPSAPKHMPAASAAAAPPLDPPADRDGSSGLRTGPKADSSLVVPNANSWRLVLPMMIAPAARRLRDGRRVRVRLGRGQGRPRRRLCAGDVDQVLDATSECRAEARGNHRTESRARLSAPRPAPVGRIASMKALISGRAPICSRHASTSVDRRDSARLHKRRNVDDLAEVRAHGS